MEADVLRWWLLIIGSLVIFGLAVHGIWLSRKNSENKETANKNNKNSNNSNQEFQPSGWQSDTDEFDIVVNDPKESVDDDLHIKFDIGVKGVDGVDKEVTSDLDNDKPSTNVTDDNDYIDDNANLNDDLGEVRIVPSDVKVDAEAEQTLQADIKAKLKIKADPEVSPSKIYASVVTQPKPEYASNHSFTSNNNYQAPEPPPFLLKKQTSEPDSTETPTVVDVEQTHKGSPVGGEQKKFIEKSNAPIEEKLSLSEQARNLVKRIKTDPVKKRLESKVAQDQMRIDFDKQLIAKPASKEAFKETLKAKPVLSKQPQEVLVLNVKCADENPIPGSALLPMLLTLGFKFGDQDIFHRHMNSNGKGPVLFSLANMFKPGNFDIDNLENFTTQGISLFMILPIEDEPQQVFNMMQNAARKIADEFSAQIYDGKRSLLTKQSLQQYVEKIREFERQRLLRG
jgi:cell division protein ZipA